MPIFFSHPCNGPSTTRFGQQGLCGTEKAKSFSKSRHKTTERSSWQIGNIQSLQPYLNSNIGTS